MGIAAAQAYQGMENAEDQATAVVRKARIDAENQKKTTLGRAGKQKASFLSSGLTLEGTPMAVLSETYQTGIEDTQNIIDAGNTNSKNIMSAARTKAMSDIAMSAAMAGIGAMAKSAAPATQTNPFQGITTTGAAPSGGSSFFSSLPSTEGFDSFSGTSGLFSKGTV